MHDVKRQYWRNLFLFAIATSLAGAIAAGYLVVPYVRANALAHPPRTRASGLTPSDFELPFLDISFRNRNKQMLRAWYIPSKNRAAVIVAHGLGGNRGNVTAQAAILAARGYGVLLVDLTGHGDSEGDAITFAGEDIEAAVIYLQSRDEIDRQRIGVFGMSLGAMVALQAAANTKDIKAVVADGTGPTGFEDEPIPKSWDGYLKLPFYWAEYEVWKWQGVSAPRSIVNAIARISPRPIFLIVAGQDTSELELNYRFYEAAREPKAIWVIAEAHHLEGWKLRPEEYRGRIIAFLGQALLESGRF